MEGGRKREGEERIQSKGMPRGSTQECDEEAPLLNLFSMQPDKAVCVFVVNVSLGLLLLRADETAPSVWVTLGL